MKLHPSWLTASLGSIAFAACMAAASPAGAQAALPKAPAADRASSGGLTQAHPSLPGGPGLSPLEPYLVTWLLPVSGLLTVFAGRFVDRQMKEVERRRRGVAVRKSG